MTGLKQRLLSALGFLLFIAPAQAGGHLQFLKTNIIVVADTSIQNDSLLPGSPAVNDLKQGFKDLFVAPAPGNGINTDQLNPLAISFVQDYIDRFGKSMEDMKNWGKPYFDMMDAILVQHGLPKELKYLAVIESHLQSNVRSWAGAVGPWQFMPATARNFGLRVGRYYDERTDYFKSTHAACRYLTSLFGLYGDWLLVIAAYNGGPGNVNSAIKKSGSRDFWVLQDYLPLESRNHVKKFIATHYIMERQGGITTATKEEASNRMLAVLSREDSISSRIDTVSGRYNSLVIVKYIGMDIVLFTRLNPDFDKLIGLHGSYALRLPNDRMDVFLAKKNDILNESIELLLHPGQ